MKIYLVGGAVRDKLLNRPIKERDYVVVGSTPETLQSLGYQQVGNDFPVFLHPKTKDEYALARTERKSGQGYTGFICDFTPEVTLEEDLIRRDLTVNAIAEDENGNIIDPYHGRKDLNNKVLRHVSDAFCEDPLRILRVARFAARYHYLGFTIAPETTALMANMVHNGELATLTKERIWLEIEKSLSDGAITVFTDVLANIGALEQLLPCLQPIWQPKYAQQVALQLAKVNHEQSLVVSFCLWLQGIDEDDIDALNEQLRLPNQYSQALTLFVANHQNLHNETLTSAQVLTLFNQADVWRRPERLALFLATFSALGNTQKTRAALIERIAHSATSIDVQVIIKQGYQGPEIKAQLDSERLRVIEEYLED